jgi:uncharacterized membrane protein (DUF4010 family)
VEIGSFLGGLVNSTAVVAELAQRGKERRGTNHHGLSGSHSRNLSHAVTKFGAAGNTCLTGTSQQSGANGADDIG